MGSPPPLKLVIVKGPREGETHEFEPGARVQIGRVVRSNTLAIKDPGVSSKHLTITWDSDSWNWVVQDLESSNGTFLNSSKVPIPAFELVPIRDKDTLKLGEETSMVVVIEEVEEPARRLRPRREGRGRGTTKKEEEEDVRVMSESNVRVTRSRKNLGLVLGGGNRVGVEVGTRTRAGARKRVNLPELATQLEEEEKEKECDLNRVVVVKEEKVEFGSIFRGGARAEEKGKVVEFGSGSGGEGEQEKEKGSLENEGGVGEVRGLGEERNQAGFDWENGTFGEWFDYMEVWLRKEVMDKSEALIEEMRRKAERVKEYQVQMELKKCKGDVVTGC